MGNHSNVFGFNVASARQVGWHYLHKIVRVSYLVCVFAAQCWLCCAEYSILHKSILLIHLQMLVRLPPRIQCCNLSVHFNSSAHIFFFLSAVYNSETINHWMKMPSPSVPTGPPTSRTQTKVSSANMFQFVANIFILGTRRAQYEFQSGNFIRNVELILIARNPRSDRKVASKRERKTTQHFRHEIAEAKEKTVSRESNIFFFSFILQ